jgi:Carboxypeptidase regulatory-like domain/TonB dependent receptor
MRWLNDLYFCLSDMVTFKKFMIRELLTMIAVMTVVGLTFDGLATAQTNRAIVTGTVTDEKGAVVARVKIIAKNLDTNLFRETASDDLGRYRIPELPPGRYEVTAQGQGFRPRIHRGIGLTVGREVVVDFTLNIGNVEDKIVIEGDAALVETTSSTVKHLVNRRQVEELPLNGRDVLQLATLQNGVVSTASIGDTQENVGPGTTRLIVNGARLDSNIYYLDGTDTADAFANSPGGLGGGFLGVDALREFQVLTSNYSAEYGVGGGAIVNAITKSGSNQFHGTAFEFLRNSALDARNFFNAQKLPFRRNQFGGSLGGPVVKDRTFFFFNYEGLRRREGTSNLFFVPSPDARQGLLVDPEIPGADPNDPILKSQITIAPSVLPYLALYPTPNGAISGDTGVYRRDVNESANEDFFTARLDHRLTSKHSLFGRYTLDDSNLRNGAGVIVDRVLNNQNHYVTLEGQSVLSPRAINTLRASYSRNKFGSAFPFTVPVGPELSFVPGQPMGAFQVQGFSELRPALATPTSFALNNIEVSEQFIYNRNAHAFKFGGMVHRYQLNADSTLVPDGIFIYDGGVGPFLTGTPSVLFVPAPGKNFYRGIRQTLFGFYAQDDWRVRPNLTINLGMRYEPITTPTEVNGKVANLRNFTDPATTVGDPFIENPSKRSFAPRIGIAWDPFGNGLWSVRGGFGVFNASLRPMQYRFAISNQPPFGELVVLPGAFPNAYSTFINNPIPAPGLLWLMQFDAEQPTVYQWNLTVQRELGKNLVVSAGYIGSRGVHLLTNASTNVRTDFQMVDGQKFYPALLDDQGMPDRGAIQRARFNPNFDAMQLTAFNGDSYYNALQLSATKRFSAGLQFQIAYTYSKSTDITSATESVYQNGVTGGDFQDPLDPAMDKALSDFDIRHNFVANFIWELPFGKGRKLGNNVSGAADKFISGWGVGGILHLRTGFPFCVTLGTDRANNGIDNRRSQMPNLAPGRSFGSAITGDPSQYVDPTAFVLQPAGFYGNLGRNTLPGPNMRTFDFSVLKKTRINERINMEFRGEFFNLFNITNFSPPNATNRVLFSGNFGQLSSTSVSSRQIQFGLKFIW